ncbi:MAG: RHS repeat-associated core domain-containing protein [Bacteroidales bacterium]
MQKTQSDVSIDAIASGFQSGIAEMAGISFCLENLAACGFRVGFGEIGSISTYLENAAASDSQSGFGEMVGISTRGGHLRAFIYDYVKTYPEHLAPHDLSASQSEAPRPECVVIDVAKCGFQSGIGEMASISFCLESAIASGFRYSIGEIGSISTCWVNVAASGFRVGFGEMANISSRGGHVRAFTYDYVKTRPEHPAPHDLLSSGGGKVCFATTPPDMEASCKASQQSGYDSRYTFSAKELDDETQYSYFGARYYDSDLSVWLSIDRYAGKYPNLSPYQYCAWNPVNAIDINGDSVIDGNGNIVNMTILLEKDDQYRVTYQFAENTSDEVKQEFMKNTGRLFNEMVKIEEGRTQIEAAVSSEEHLRYWISPEKCTNKDGDLVGGTTVDKKLPDGQIYTLITIYEGSAKEYVKNDGNYDRLTVNQKMATNAGHETYHATNSYDIHVRRDLGRNLTAKEHEGAYTISYIMSSQFGMKNKGYE